MGALPLRVSPFLVAASAVVLGSCSDDAVPPGPPPAPAQVTALAVVPADVPIDFEFVGKTAATRRVEIRSRVDGFLEERRYQEGGVVHAGDLMFVMDKKPFEAALRAAEAEHKQQVAREENARANLDRIEPLVEKNAVPQKDLDDARGMWLSAKASVEAAAAKVTQAELDLSYCDIVSPVNGVASYADKDEGTYVGFGTSSLLTYVQQVDPMYVEFSVSEYQLLKAQEAGRSGEIVLPDEDIVAEILLADGSTYPHTGTVTFADVSLSDRTGTFLMRAEFENKDMTLKPGQFVRIQLTGAYRPNTVTVPQRAVMHGAAGPYLWVVDEEGNAEHRPVVTGAWHGDDWIIRSGLEGDETVVVDGGLRLRPGVPVQITEAKAAAEQG